MWPLTQPETNAAAKANDPQVTQVLTTLEPSQANKVSKQTFGYDKYTNQTDVEEYDFGTGAPSSSPVRRTHTDYLTSGYDTLNPIWSNPDLNLTSHLRSLPTRVSVYDTNNVERARTTSEYDNYISEGSLCPQSFHCSLQPRENISGLDSSFTTSYTTRGNATAVTRYLLSNGAVIGSVTAYSNYDVAGNAVRSIDPRSTISNIIATTIDYDDRFGTPDSEAQSNSAPAELGPILMSFAFPTKVINPLGHTAYAQFDYHLGKPVNSEDANQVVASGSYNDAFDRPKQIRRAIGTTAENQTSFDYNDVARVVTTRSDRDSSGDNLLVSEVRYDQMGRTKETRQYEGGSNYIAVETQYDALGRPFRTSNPFRPWQGQAAVWTEQAFDALGRVKTVTTPDNAVVATDYSGERVLVTDQTGKQRISKTNALGQLTEVWEVTAPDSATEAITFPFHPEVTAGYRTSYQYDVLDNLTTVAQGNQTRTFVYDSLKRLKTATNPESGTVSYNYDNNSNLIQKTDARGIVSSYIYDALNRNTTIDHSNTASINPDITRVYDTATNGKGKLCESYAGGTESSGANVEHTKIVSYDAMGRPLDQRQRFKSNSVWSAEFQTQRAYNRAGGVTSQTYPSLRTISHGFDPAGRLETFNGTLGDGVNRNYATEILYSPFGGTTKEKFGTDTPLYNKSFYNNRGQLSEIRVGTTYTGPTDTGWQRGAIINHYTSQCWGACSGTDNNGNLKQQDHFIPDSNGGVQTVFSQSYAYDNLNRLLRVQEGSWQQEFVYDRWGNRTIHQTNTLGDGINKKAFAVNAANNRLGVPAGLTGTMNYDNAGNLITDTYSGAGSREYDAENRMTKAWGGNNQWQSYTYNADGQRTRRKVDDQETWQIYGFEGELLAEYAVNGPAASPQKEYGYRNGQLLVTAANNPPPPAGPPPPTSGLVAYWKFDENSGTTAADSSGGGHTGTLTNGPTWSTGQAGGALAFDGADDLVSNNGIANVTNNFTISFWAQPTATHELDGESTAGVSGSSGQRYALWPAWYNNGHAGAGVSVGTNGVSVYEHSDGYMPATLVYAGSLSGWTHIAIVYENKQPKLYLNGSLVRTGLSSPMSFVHLNPGFIGGQVYGYYGGKLDELRTYNRALTASEVSTLLSSAQTFTASTDFNNTQGFRHWYYVDENNTLMTYDAVNNVWVGSEGPYQWLWAAGGHPGASHDVVRQWRAPQSGSIQITGSVADDDPGGGDGVLITIKKGTQNLWQQTVVNGNTTGLTYDLSTTVQSGDQISFIINRVGSTSWDATVFNPTITFTPSGAGGGSQINWLVTDHLGTPRMIIDQTGSLANVKRHDYLPFGEGLFAPAGGRSTGLGYASGDGVRQQFTIKERDVETGLDYFLARYYSSLQGRFTSPDEFTGGPDELYNFADDASDNPTFYAEFANPQSLNKYQYTYNNPLNLTDPDGHCPPCLAAAAAAAVVILMSPDTTQAPTGNETQPLARSGDGMQRAVAVGMASAPVVRTVATLENARSAAATEKKARQAETDKLAQKVADEAQASGVTSGSAGASIAKTGERFTALSGESKLHPIVQKIYDKVPLKVRKVWHSKCCEGNTTSQMIDAGVNPRGATHSVVRIRKPGHPDHGTQIPTCPSCAYLFKNIDRIFK